MKHLDNTKGGKNMSEEQIKHMVNRFLGWKLPENFAPDAGISYTKPENPVWSPTGTNLFDATQATAMVNYMLEDLPKTKKEAKSCPKQNEPRTPYKRNSPVRYSSF